MRALLLAALILVPVLAGAYHYGPGQEKLTLDDTERVLAEARQSLADKQYDAAVDDFTKALGMLPAERIDESAQIRVERAKAMLHGGKLPEAYDDMTLLLEELEQSEESVKPEILADAHETLANAKYYLTWLMRLEGEPRPEWEPEIEAARQTYRLLAEQATTSGDTADAKRYQEDLEAAIRLARMDLDELQALPLPSQCKGCCSGNCKCKGKGKKKGKGQGKSQKKSDSDQFARGASSGPPPDDGGN